MNNCCGNCTWNEDGFCDCKGLFIQDDNVGCKSWESNKRIESNQRS